MCDASHYLDRREFCDFVVQFAEGINSMLMFTTEEASEFIACIHCVGEPPFRIGPFERFLCVFPDCSAFQGFHERAEARLIPMQLSDLP